MDETEEPSAFLSTLLYGVIAAGVLFVIRQYVKGGQFTERASAKGKVAVVTGANSGVGLETTRELNLRGAKVYMLCRSEDTAQAARKELVKKGCDPTRLIFVQCNLADFSSVRKAADELRKAEKAIDILINNAGVMLVPKYATTVDGHELTWQSNHLGHFLLTELLLPQLEEAGGRIVIVSSKLHLDAKSLDLGTIDDKKAFGRLSAYNKSKLANVMHARGLTNKLRSKGINTVTANALHPGVVYTNLLRTFFLDAPGIREITAPFRWFALKTPKDGAQTSLYLALSKHAAGVSGKYFADCKQKTMNPVAEDDDACSALYNYSLEAVGLAK